MKKIVMSMLLASTLMLSSCLGSFSAVSGLKNWNDGISDSKFVNNLVFWGLNIIPVYGLFVLGDAIIFNVIEFWSGSNPIAMNDGDFETQIIEKDGNKFKLTATKNKMSIVVIEGPKKGQTLDMEYIPADKSWNAIKPSGEVIKLSSYEEGFYIVYLPNGEKVKVDPAVNKTESLAFLKQEIAEYTGNTMLAQE